MSLLLDDAENMEVAAALKARDPVAGLVDEMRHVDHHQGIGAFEHERAAHRQVAQRRLRPQDHVRATHAAQIEHLLSLGFHPAILSPRAAREPREPIDISLFSLERDRLAGRPANSPLPNWKVRSAFEPSPAARAKKESNSDRTF